MKKVVASGESDGVQPRMNCLRQRRVTTKSELKIGSDNAKEYPG